jgi:hypothetical protein
MGEKARAQFGWWSILIAFLLQIGLFPFLIRSHGIAEAYLALFSPIALLVFAGVSIRYKKFRSGLSDIHERIIKENISIKRRRQYLYSFAAISVCSAIISIDPEYQEWFFFAFFFGDAAIGRLAFEISCLIEGGSPVSKR